MTQKCKTLKYKQLTLTILFSLSIYNFVFLISVAVSVVDGEVLHIVKISRLHMGAYLCIASNGVPPSVSTRVSLRVQCKY